MHLYETHLHTSPVSKCAIADVAEVVNFYKDLGYAGIFITNHFLDGNINIDRELPYEERINFYFSDYERAKALGDKIGLDVFFGAELSYKGTDFLVYGLDKAWFLSHPEIMQMKKSEELPYLMEHGALVIQAHPFREAGYIDHIRLFPRSVHGVEVFNACRNDFENKLAVQYCENYALIPFAGSDNHIGGGMQRFGGMATEERIGSVVGFIDAVLSGKAKPFIKDESGVRLL